MRREAPRAFPSTPLVTPLYQSAVYVAESPDALDAAYEGRAPAPVYAREGHPNAQVLATKIDWLEGLERDAGEGGIITSSGMGAIAAAALAVLSEGDHVLGATQLYGRTTRMLRRDLPRLGFPVTVADPTDAAAIAAAIRPETRLIVVETVSNPTLRVADIPGIIAAAREAGALVMVDNTFTTPRAFRPFEWGADIVVHSVTKLLAGHSDATLGYVAARDPELRADIEDAAITWGLTPSPFDCWLAERGLHSFALRYDRVCENAAELADHLADLPQVEQVLYPGRADHPDHALAQRLFGGQWGNIVTFRLGIGRPRANRFVRGAGGLAFAPTLGDIATTLSHPVSSSHRSMPRTERVEQGITEGTFRLSVGIEDIELLKEELERAIAAALDD
ncbi:MAG: aminotransferase class V-fold PLP-dependent enzyme [Rhodobacteraceae bacterium]|nr:aminotransferase class V-fold PLP-dependent enzyme [Paracoccaceae bacterium]